MVYGHLQQVKELGLAVVHGVDHSLGGGQLVGGCDQGGDGHGYDDSGLEGDDYAALS